MNCPNCNAEIQGVVCNYCGTNTQNYANLQKTVILVVKYFCSNYVMQKKTVHTPKICLKHFALISQQHCMVLHHRS